MTKIDIYSGFLGAGKTTLIKKLLSEAYAGMKVVLIENEFGEIGVDGGFLKDAGVEIKELNAGCICCSLTGDFKEALKMVEEQYHPDRIIIEPSGVGKLSEVAAAVMATGDPKLEIGGLTTVVDAAKCKMYMKNFGEFFDDQLKFAHTIVLSRSQYIDDEKLQQVLELIREQNKDAEIITAPWDDLDGKQILAAIDGRDELSEALHHMIEEHLEEEEEECDDPECECHHHHHHDHDEDDDEHEPHHHHHHHDDDDDEDGDHDEHEHHHHHDHDEHDDDDHDDDHEHEHHGHHHEHHHHHHHHHHGEHDADEVFESIGHETARRYTEDELEQMLLALDDTEKYGLIIRAKGIVENKDGGWIHFDYTPGEVDIRSGAAALRGLVCVIGHEPKEEAIEELFKLH